MAAMLVAKGHGWSATIRPSRNAVNKGNCVFSIKLCIQSISPKKTIKQYKERHMNNNRAKHRHTTCPYLLICKDNAS